MHRYLIKIPWWVKKLFPHYLWSVTGAGKRVYLTFDDGPHPVITPWVLEALKKCNAKATFFCVGKNVTLFPQVYHQIIADGHAVGNHTFHHINGWKTGLEDYTEDVKAATSVIRSSLFRPPYGRIRRNQAAHLSAIKPAGMQVIMWDVLSGDFDPHISKEQCLKNVVRHATAGSIIVFHDSEKAYKNLNYALPLVLRHLAEQGYTFEKLENNADMSEYK